MNRQDACYDIIAQRNHSQQTEIEAAGLIIEIIGEGGHEQQTQGERTLKEHIYKGKTQEHHQKQARGEYHGFV
jgi:hypothetical protein